MAIKWEELVQNDWAELSALSLIIIGFFVAILLRSPVLSYISIICAGFLAGRVYYIKHRKEPILPFVLMITGFLAGYFLGSFWVSRILVIILFGVSMYISYKLHVKKIITIFKSQNYIK